MGRDVLWGRNQRAVKHPVMNLIFNLSSLFALHFLWYTIKLGLTKPGTQLTQSFTGNCPVQGKSLQSGIKPRRGKLLRFRESPICGTTQGVVVWVLFTPNQRRFPGEAFEAGLGGLAPWNEAQMGSMAPREEGLGCPTWAGFDPKWNTGDTWYTPNVQKGCLENSRGKVIWGTDQTLKTVKRDCHEQGVNPDSHPGLGSSPTEFQQLRNFFLYSQNPQTSSCRNIIITIQLWASLKQEGERRCCHPKVSACLASSKARGAEPGQGRGSSCCTPDSSHCPQFLSPASCCPASACPAQSSGTLVCSQRLRIQMRAAFPSPEPTVPGQGALQPQPLLPSPREEQLGSSRSKTFSQQLKVGGSWEITILSACIS